MVVVFRAHDFEGANPEAVEVGERHEGVFGTAAVLTGIRDPALTSIVAGGAFFRMVGAVAARGFQPPRGGARLAPRGGPRGENGFGWCRRGAAVNRCPLSA